MCVFVYMNVSEDARARDWWWYIRQSVMANEGDADDKQYLRHNEMMLLLLFTVHMQRVRRRSNNSNNNNKNGNNLRTLYVWAMSKNGEVPLRFPPDEHWLFQQHAWKTECIWMHTTCILTQYPIRERNSSEYKTWFMRAIYAHSISYVTIVRIFHVFTTSWTHNISMSLRRC